LLGLVSALEKSRALSFVAPFSIAAGAIFIFCALSTISHAKVCAICLLKFSRLYGILITERKKEVHKMKMRFYENDFERMFDEAVEELEREAQEQECED
jgi:hypothetical protein